MNLKERAKKLKRDIPAVVFALKDRETPLAAKITAGVAVAYALSPIDLIPDFIPLLGYLDDVILLPALIELTIKLIPAAVWARSLEKARETGGQSVKKWYFALPVILVWLLILWLVVKAIWF